MKRLLFLCLFFALVACSRQEAPAAQRGLGALQGQWVLVNYWAQWCKPCIEEIPELNVLDRKHDNVTVLGVNYDGATGEELDRQTRELGVEFNSLERDPAAELGVARPVVLPSTFVIDPGGQLVTTLVGPQTLESLEQATVLSRAPDAQ
jgi:thiol-disulfide isomerase/thioredoxin